MIDGTSSSGCCDQKRVDAFVEFLLGHHLQTLLAYSLTQAYLSFIRMSRYLVKVGPAWLLFQPSMSAFL